MGELISGANATMLSGERSELKVRSGRLKRRRW